MERKTSPKNRFWYSLFITLPWLYTIMIMITSGYVFIKDDRSVLRYNKSDCSTDAFTEKIAFFGFLILYIGIPTISFIIIEGLKKCFCCGQNFQEWWTDSCDNNYNDVIIPFNEHE